MKLSFRNWMLITALLPAFVVFTGNVFLVWNHFLVGPFLHDAGWFSALVYRAGLFPKNPLIANLFPEFYGMHVSPIISLGSLVSYLLPISRIPYFCLFEGALAAPMGVAIALLVGRKGQKSSWLDAVLVAFLALVFALHGLVMGCISYPHFEVLLPAGLCIMLAGLANNQVRIAWVGLVLAVLTREDGGLHAAAFLVAVFASGLFRRPFPVSQRNIFIITGTAVALSVLAIIAQKMFFSPASLFEDEYLGNPPYAHINAEMLATRFHRMFVKGAVVTYPLLATCLIAAIKRDARYLLGWLVELPWLLLNFLAHQELKSVFSIYTGFPFIASVFWVGAYARVKEEKPQQRYWLVPVLSVAMASTLGAYVSWPRSITGNYKSMLGPNGIPSKGIEAFSADLIENPDRYGHLYVDPGMASWTIESMWPQSLLWGVRDNVRYDGHDGVAFFASGLWGRSHIRHFLAASPFKRCGKIEDTEVYFCGLREEKLPPQFRPAPAP